MLKIPDTLVPWYRKAQALIKSRFDNLVEKEKYVIWQARNEFQRIQQERQSNIAELSKRAEVFDTSTKPHPALLKQSLDLKVNHGDGLTIDELPLLHKVKPERYSPEGIRQEKNKLARQMKNLDRNPFFLIKARIAAYTQLSGAELNKRLADLERIEINDKRIEPKLKAKKARLDDMELALRPISKFEYINSTVI